MTERILNGSSRKTHRGRVYQNHRLGNVLYVVGLNRGGEHYRRYRAALLSTLRHASLRAGGGALPEGVSSYATGVSGLLRAMGVDARQMLSFFPDGERGVRRFLEGCSSGQSSDSGMITEKRGEGTIGEGQRSPITISTEVTGPHSLRSFGDLPSPQSTLANARDVSELGKGSSDNRGVVTIYPWGGGSQIQGAVGKVAKDKRQGEPRKKLFGLSCDGSG